MYNRKEKLTVQQQIEHMKSKGILFNVENEEFAKDYLENNTYYFKLKAYAKLYNKYPKGENQGKYINLEFAYLRDLATIDSLIRKKIFCIASDIEHYLKVSLLHDFNLSCEDGYEIIEDFIKNNENNLRNEIDSKLRSSTCGDLVRKYVNDLSIWNIVEIISFNDFSKLYSLFYTRNNQQFGRGKINYRGPYYYLINPVRILRNAAAHNNCLLIGLSKSASESFNFENKVASFLGRKGIKNTSLSKQLSKPLIHDFCVMLFLYSKIAPKSAQKYVFNDLKDLFNGRIAKNKDYYTQKSLISSAYEFIVKVINVFCQNLDFENP